MLETADEIATAAVLAALLEASAPKPGNVSPTAHFRDMRYEHFLAAAAAMGPAFRDVSQQTLGTTIHRAVSASRRWSPANANLGIVLLLAPLAHAAARSEDELPGGTRDLRTQLRSVVSESTIDDARVAYAAIRLAAPAGLGRVEHQDVSGAPSVTMREAMLLAADHDAIAREYSTGFELTFETGAPLLRRALNDGLSWADAVVECFLSILSWQSDSLIARKLGQAAAAEVSTAARRIMELGGVRTIAGRGEIASFDAGLRDPSNTRNPGTTADLTAAAIYVVLLEGHWTMSNASDRT
jgi:triphosphoribosyl-dephospho-CoA synthase